METPGIQLDRRCGGGLQAVVTAAMMVQSGAADVVLAGGVESMSNVEYYSLDARWGARSGSVRLHDRLERGRERTQPAERFGPISGMIETAENLARHFGVEPDVRSQVVCVDRRRQWRKAGNLSKNAAIRTFIWTLGTPVRWLRRPFTRRRASES